MSKTNNLTIEDIHEIRYENYENTKGIPFSELVRQTTQKAQTFKKRLVKYAQQQSILTESYILAEPETSYNTNNE